MIEIFARNELGLEIEEGQVIIPISDASAESLSAILLDDDYFDLIRTNLVMSESGVPLVSAPANICLKARAHRDLSERHAKGDRSFDERNILKHLKDIWRLGVTLTGEEVITVGGDLEKDVVAAIGKLEKLPGDQFKQMMKGTPAKLADVMAALRKIFVKDRSA